MSWFDNGLAEFDGVGCAVGGGVCELQVALGQLGEESVRREETIGGVEQWKRWLW